MDDVNGIPEIRVGNDYDGYFENLVKTWVVRKAPGPYRHKVIRITAGPYRSSAVSFRIEGDTLHLDFYAALRVGFGSLDESEVAEITALL